MLLTFNFSVSFPFPPQIEHLELELSSLHLLLSSGRVRVQQVLKKAKEIQKAKKKSGENLKVKAALGISWLVEELHWKLREGESDFAEAQISRMVK